MEGVVRQGAGEMLVGMVERVTFHNAETGFCVLRVQVRRLRRADLPVAVRMPRALEGAPVLLR
jgi:exodeoxyribonuclease V alpha subunit